MKPADTILTGFGNDGSLMMAFLISPFQRLRITTMITLWSSLQKEINPCLSILLFITLTIQRKKYTALFRFGKKGTLLLHFHLQQLSLFEDWCWEALMSPMSIRQIMNTT